MPNYAEVTVSMGKRTARVGIAILLMAAVVLAGCQQAGQEETPSGSPGDPSDGDRERRDGDVFR